ncbi:MAG: ergothioneine biosynthesis protein EgtB [Nitrosospira sp.]|nr:ergothioneine biosynthesis protein EgtB [Nitrosospira sp.]
MNQFSLYPAYIAIRKRTLGLIEPLSDEDCCVQSMSEASPVKWHLGHTAWFFENFILQHYEKPFKPFHEVFSHMFSSYNAEGQTEPDSKRGLFTRPSLGEIHQYCHNVDERINRVLGQADRDEILRTLTILGMNHEQQHQELILTDIKHLLSQSPLDPCYRSEARQQRQGSHAAQLPLEWHDFTEGIVEIGHQGDDFSYDNESPRHKHYLQSYRLASRLITNGEYLQFMESGGYENPKLWLSEGLDWVKANESAHPLYWRADKSGWKEFTVHGLQSLDLNLPVIHVSFYEADAFARWYSSRLPTEAEWENAAAGQPIEGCFADNNRFHPDCARRTESGLSEILQLYGDAWEWTQSSYSAYPGYSPFQPDLDKPMSQVWNEAVGEYNSRSMVNQYVLRGGSCLVPQKRIRPSFRNFLHAKTRWQVTGIRLARDLVLVN